MDNNYRIKKLKEAWKILKEEFYKREIDRSENRINHASYLINTFAEDTELPQEICWGDLTDDIVFDINYFDTNTILEYADKMLRMVDEPENAATSCENVVDLKSYKNKRESEFTLPEIEEAKRKVRDIIELSDYMCLSSIAESISKAMAEKGDIDRLKRMLNLIFEVFDCPQDPRHGNFPNNIFAKRLWLSLNMVQKRWLIKNNFVDKEVITVLSRLGN